MRLNRIELRGWQCFVNDLAIGPFAPGLNVIHAPNGRGKSTLFAALRRAIFDGHRTGGAEMQALRPWGRDLTPSVAVELQRTGETYRVEKRFLDQPSARLLRWEGNTFVPLAENESADERTRQLMFGVKPGRGTADKPEHWGLAGVLWVPQGDLRLTEVSGPLASRIRTSLARQTGIAEPATPHLPTANGVEAEIERRYAATFTAEGRFRTGQNAAAVVTLEQRLLSLEAERAELIPKVDAFDDASRRVDELRAERAHASRREQQAEQSLTRIREAVAAYERLDAMRRESALREAKARDDHAALDRTITAIADGRAKLCDANAELTRLREVKPSLDAAAASARARADAASEKRISLTARRDEVDKALKHAEAAAEYLRACALLRELDARLARAAESVAALQAADQALLVLNAPTARELQAIRRADADRRDARTRLEASLISLTIESTVDAQMNVRIGDVHGPTSLTAGVTAVVRGSPEVLIDLPGVGTIRASGPAGSVDDLRAALEAAGSRFAAAVARFDSTDVEELQRRSDRSVALAADRAGHRSLLDAALNGRTMESLAHDRAGVAAQVDRLVNVDPTWRATPPDPAALLDSARSRRTAFDRETSDALHAYEIAVDARARADQAVRDHAVRVESVQQSIATITNGLAQHEAGFCDDASRSRRLADLHRDWTDARQSLDNATAKLADFTADPRESLATAMRELEQLRAAATTKNEAEKRAEGQLEQLAQAGAYSKLSEVLEAIEATTQELARERATAAAIKLLRDTLHAERRRAVEAVSGPVEQLATEILHRITGRRLGPIRLDESFAARGVMPTALNGNDDPVDLERLSGGEQEQVHLAVRLALADVLARTEGNQLVVLDDVLIATDSGRLGRVRTVLAEAAQRLQIVVLTCHPERYSSMDGVAYFDLEALVDG